MSRGVKAKREAWMTKEKLQALLQDSWQKGFEQGRNAATARRDDAPVPSLLEDVVIAISKMGFAQAEVGAALVGVITGKRESRK